MDGMTINNCLSRQQRYTQQSGSPVYLAEVRACLLLLLHTQFMGFPQQQQLSAHEAQLLLCALTRGQLKRKCKQTKKEEKQNGI